MRPGNIRTQGLLTLLLAAMIAACEGTPAEPASPATDAPLPPELSRMMGDRRAGLNARLATPQNIDFGPANTIDRVLVTVHRFFLRPRIAARTSIDMTITSVNGIDHFHGADVIPLTEVEIFDDGFRLVDVIVRWTEDEEQMVVNDVYTVCANLVFDRFLGGSWVGPETCVDFGPFF